MAGSHRAAAQGRRRGNGRGRPRRARALAAGLSFLVLLTAGAGWVYLRLDGDISTFGTDGLSKDRPGQGAGGQNVLVIGSDSRSGKNSDFGGGKGDVGRSDTAFLLHIYDDQKHAVAVSFPRDALVDIPACKEPKGGWTQPQSNVMFNSAFTVGQTAEGNPACTQNTVEHLTGLRVDHTVVVDFSGFAGVTSAIGGVPVCVPNDIYEGDLNPNKGAKGQRVFREGKQTVEGRKALDYVRLRHGIGDGSDIGRIKRQQAFVASLMKKVKDQGFSPGTLFPLAEAAVKSMTVDEELGSARKMVAFAMQMKDIDLHNTKFVTLPSHYAGARIGVDKPAADKLWADLKNDRPLTSGGGGGGGKGSSGASKKAVSGEGTQVRVSNGTAVSGLAARAAGELKEHGFTVTGTGNGTQVPTTAVSYGPGEKEGAQKAARLFPGAKVTEGQTPGVTVTLGDDYASRDAPPASGKNRSADDDVCADLSYG